MSDRAFRFVSGFFFLAAAVAVILLLTRPSPHSYRVPPDHDHADHII